MSTLNPSVPIKASHRFLKKFLSVTLDGKVETVPSEFDRLSHVFRRAGGSWEGVFKGSPDAFALLKKVVDVAYEKGYLTHKEKWGAK